jgi:hypothetical protein
VVRYADLCRSRPRIYPIGRSPVPDCRMPRKPAESAGALVASRESCCHRVAHPVSPMPELIPRWQGERFQLCSSEGNDMICAKTAAAPLPEADTITRPGVRSQELGGIG